MISLSLSVVVGAADDRMLEVEDIVGEAFARLRELGVEVEYTEHRDDRRLARGPLGGVTGRGGDEKADAGGA
jgi:hypothetical protein